MKAKDFRRTAREGLKGNWILSILVTLIAVLLGASAGSGHSAVNSAFTSGGNSNTGAVQSTLANFQISPAIIGIILAVISLAFIYVLIAIAVGGAAKMGLITYYIDLLTKRSKPEFGTLFSRFYIFGKAFMLQVLTGVYIFLWTLLFIIPGIIKMYSYAMAPYILAENPDLSPGEAISRSKELMKGNKWRLACLELSFIGWHLLGALTAGIGYLWLNPYIGVSETAFYMEISEERSVA